MRSILAGIETEYGLLVDGEGADTQIENATTLVRAYPGEGLAVWDYRNESPRNDLRGFRLDRLEFDPEDAKFDIGKTRASDVEIRSDRILPNGARFYNDHGHPEYSTPECWTLADLARHDLAGQTVVHEAGRALELKLNKPVHVYKNNTDYHGSSYGTHEGYLIPRTSDIARLAACVIPILVARPLLCGAGKVGAESGDRVDFQLSQRADFFVEPMNAETLYRRPIFNTRDEAHADPAQWIRLHVIAGDANMMTACTVRKVGLMKIALGLWEAGVDPLWKLSDPVRAAKMVSRDLTGTARIPLEGSSWTTSELILRELIAAGRAELDLEPELLALCDESEDLLDCMHDDLPRFARRVDWAAKHLLMHQIVEAENLKWHDSALQSYCLEYHNVAPEEGLFFALEADGALDANVALFGNELIQAPERSRATARGLAVTRFGAQVVTASWRSIVLRDRSGTPVEIELPPELEYPLDQLDVEDVDSFIDALKSLKG